ncbi:MAG: alpha/beta fold hydrolase [Pyrinomonadaceae bacterium]
MQARPAMDPSVIRRNYAKVGDLSLHYAECGAEHEELVILLHGFPEFWYSWRHQLPVLGARFHVVAPDMRGYNLSDKPARVENYRIDRLVADVVGLIHYFDKSRAAIIAHDWGAAVAWAVAQRHSEAVTKLAALQVPMPGAWRANLTLRQLRASWYMFFFQLPRLPEWWASANDFKRLDDMFRTTTVRAGAFSEADIAAYKDALRQPGALTAAINYYRANVFRSLLRGGSKPGVSQDRLRVPTLFIYGEHDMAIMPETVRDLSRFVDGPYSELRIPDSGHWVQNEAIEEVNTALLDFLRD